MAKKIDYRNAMKRAAEAPIPQEIDPFARAEETLRRRPTGFTTAEEHPAPPAATAAPAAEKPSGKAASAPAPAKPAAAAAAQAITAGAAFSAEHKEIMEKLGQAGLKLGEPRFELVPLDLIDENPYNARHIYMTEKVNNLSTSMRERGQLIPGLAAARGERRVLIAGHYRKKAATLAGIQYLKLMVYDNVSDQELYILSYKENTEQTEQTPLDNALAWRKLLDNGVFSTETAIGEAIGMSKANINKTLAILKLEPSVMAYVEQDPTAFALSSLYELVLLQQTAGAPSAAEMASRVLENGIGRKEIQQARERYEAKEGISAPRRQNERSRTYPIWHDSVNIGKIKEWDSGKVAMEVTFTDADAKSKFIEAVRKMITSGQAVATAPQDEGQGAA